MVRVSTETVVDGQHTRKTNIAESEDIRFGGVAILHPPKNSRRKWDPQRIWEGLMLKIKDWIDPAGDEGSDMEVCYTYSHNVTLTLKS